MAFYVKKANKPVEAKLLTELNRDEILEWLSGMGHKGPDGSIRLKTLESDGETQTAATGYYIIKGYSEAKGWHFWPVESSYFKENYMEVDIPATSLNK